MKRLVVAVLLVTNVATAYPGAPTGVVSESARADGKKRFDLALALFDEGNESGALAELTRAWELTGNLVVLYNIGIVQLSLGRYVLADAALTEVLAASPDPLKPEQRKRALDAQQKARARIGQVRVVPQLPEGASPALLNNAIVELDGVEVARWPMTAPLRVSVGKHSIGFIATGHAPLRREVNVAGQTTVDVEMSLVAMAGKVGQISIAVSVPSASVSLDGALVGTSPLDKGLAVAPGTHVIEAKRAGYVTASSTVNAGADATTQVTLSLAADPVAIKSLGAGVIVTPSEPAALIEIDGAPRTGERIALPPGVHSLHVEKTGFLPTSRTFSLEPGATAMLSIALIPTPETLSAHDSAVSFHRTWGLVGVGSGVVLATVGALLYFPGRATRADALVRYEAHEASKKAPMGRCYSEKVGGAAADCAAIADAINDDIASGRTKMNVGLPMLIAGPVLLGAGVVLLLTGPSARRFDAVRPSVAVAPGGGYVGFTWAF